MELIRRFWVVLGAIIFNVGGPIYGSVTLWSAFSEGRIRVHRRLGPDYSITIDANPIQFSLYFLIALLFVSFPFITWYVYRHRDEIRENWWKAIKGVK
jgi:uncharacterized membrane protein YhaH (DUF805 family)